jgi:serine phosphatase RsbU (regulator of sigma subunit)
VALEEKPTGFEAALAGPSDVLFFYTDGATDALNAEGQRLGLDGLLEIVRRVSFDSLQDATEAIPSAVLDWSGRSLVDDLTLFALRWNGPG